jgi:hypothetical protein
MLRKEIREALKRFIESLVGLFVVPFVYIGDKLVTKTGLDYASLFQTGILVTLIVYAVFAGATVLRAERKDRAFEYLFSLPLTRRRIILVKIWPRLALLLFLEAVATLINGPGFLEEMGITLLVLFFGSVFLSIGVFSVMMSLFGVGFMYLIFFRGTQVAALFLQKLGVDLSGRQAALAVQLISAALLLVPFGVAFWLTFKKMDVRPLKLQMRQYYSIIVPTLFILVTLIALFSKRLVPSGLQGH